MFPWAQDIMGGSQIGMWLLVLLYYFRYPFLMFLCNRGHTYCIAFPPYKYDSYAPAIACICKIVSPLYSSPHTLTILSWHESRTPWKTKGYCDLLFYRSAGHFHILCYWAYCWCMNRLNETESAIFDSLVCTLLPKDPTFQNIFVIINRWLSLCMVVGHGALLYYRNGSPLYLSKKTRYRNTCSVFRNNCM